MADNHEWGSEANRASVQQKWNELQQANLSSSEHFYFDPAETRFPVRWPTRLGDAELGKRAMSADNDLPDGKTADAAIAALRKLRSERFFLGSRISETTFALRRSEEILRPLPRERDRADREHRVSPRHARFRDARFRRGCALYDDIPQAGPIPKDKARELIRGYYASISYVDAQIGKLLHALDELGLRDNTVIVLWGITAITWASTACGTNTRISRRRRGSPLIVSVPGQRNADRKTPALTEFVDIYPSLCEICGVSRPRGLEGSSFVPLINDPERLWKRAAFSQYPREIPGAGPGMGHSIRTRRYRYTEWTVAGTSSQTSELYDYEMDPLENFNIANHPRNLSLVNGLSGMLREGWRGSLPPPDGPA